MDNNANNTPLGLLSPWASANKSLENLSESQKEVLRERKRDLTFNMLTYEATFDEKIIWNLTLCLPYELCVDIYEKSRYLSSDLVKDLLFPHYEMSEAEEFLFSKITSFGSARGLSEVMASVYSDAKLGKEKDISNRMKYLDIMLERGEEKAKSAIVKIILDGDVDDDSDDFSKDPRKICSGGKVIEITDDDDDKVVDIRR